MKTEKIDQGTLKARLFGGFLGDIEYQGHYYIHGGSLPKGDQRKQDKERIEKGEPTYSDLLVTLFRGAQKSFIAGKGIYHLENGGLIQTVFASEKQDSEISETRSYHREHEMDEQIPFNFITETIYRIKSSTEKKEITIAHAIHNTDSEGFSYTTGRYSMFTYESKPEKVKIAHGQKTMTLKDVIEKG